MSAGRMKYHEMCQRVTALHRAFEGRQHTGPKVPPRPKLAKREDAHTLSLDHRIRSEVSRFRRRDSKGEELVAVRAKGIALMMQRREANPAVLARFGVERALDEMLVYLNNMTDNLPAYFVAGKPFTSKGSPDFESGCISPRDLDAISRLRVSLDDIATKGTCPATWISKDPNRKLLADVVRPPMEAIVLGSHLIRHALAGPLVAPAGVYGFDMNDLGPVLCIGAGLAAAAQVLSQLLPRQQVHHLPCPYFELPVVRQPWDAIVLNIPARQLWRVAGHIGMSDKTTFIRRHAVLQKKHALARPLEHVSGLLKTAVRHRVKGKPLVLMADGEQHHEAVRRLLAAKLVEPLVVDGIDTSERPIWVGYDKQPWAPHGLPSPTGKLVSIWRWK